LYFGYKICSVISLNIPGSMKKTMKKWNFF
jgi:hypothetical protein